MPSVPASATDEASSTWLGIDGVGSSTLIQTGTAQNTGPDFGGTQYYAWVELLPDTPGVIGIGSAAAPVSPGDQMSASIVETSVNDWTISLDDNTQNWSFSQPFSYSTPGVTAEWIEEAPEINGSTATLPDYGSTSFTNLGLAGSGLSSASLYALYMANPTGAIISYPADFDPSTDSFSLFYGSPSPQVTSLSSDQGGTAGGSSITIGGNFVTGVTAVDFGGVPVPFNADVADGTVTASAPAHQAGVVDITVTTPGGTSATSAADEFTYIPPTAYTAVTPYRICDTRGTDGLSGTDAQCAGHTLSAAGTLSIQVAGTNPTGTSSGGVPSSGVSAVVLNVTATGEAAQGYLTVWPQGQSQPTTSNLNYPASKTVPNLVTVELGSTGGVSIYSLRSTDAVVDVEGYYAAPADTAGLFNSVTPYRICDTRGTNGLSGTNAQCAGQTLSSGGTLSIQVTGTNPSGTSSGGVPSSGVSAVVLNVTAIGHGVGYLTTFPQGETAPLASNLNFSSGQVVPNRVIVPVSATGQISLTSNTSTDVVVDVNGWFTDGSSDTQTGALFEATSPSRICDTLLERQHHLVCRQDRHNPYTAGHRRCRPGSGSPHRRGCRCCQPHCGGYHRPELPDGLARRAAPAVGL